jgi:pimeloyl-[acyl-carrier protein] methyl ester esterase
VSPAGGWVLVPGWGADGGAFAEVLSHLPGVAARVVGWDDLLVRGGAALAEACDALGDGPVRLAGWSLGALLALEAALGTPGRFAGVALVSGTARFCADAGHPGADPRALQAMTARLRRDRGAVERGFAASCAAPEDGAGAGDWWAAQAARFEEAALTRGLSALAALDLRSRAPALSIPVRLLHGERDAVVPVEAARALAASLPDARLTVLPGRGHALPRTAPDAVAGLLQELAASPLASGAARSGTGEAT